MNIKEIAHALGLASDKEQKLQHFAIDSREVAPGGLFFALPGEKVDGHQFLREAAKRGAIAAIVSKEYQGEDFGLELLRVGDVRLALHLLAKQAYVLRKEKVIAITGSMGKTTTKEFLACLLEGKFRVGKTEKSHNSQLTLPLTILNLQKDYDFLVLEMAMSEKGQIAKLVDIAPPDLAIVTRIAPAGIEGLKGGLEAIAEAKGEIFSQGRTKWGIISAQAAGYAPILYGGSSSKVLYGWERDFLDARVGDYVMKESKGALTIREKDGSHSPEISLSFEGHHLWENFLAAAAAARMLGLSWADIGARASLLRPFSNRFEKFQRGGITFIQDSYNANPDSMRAAFENLPKGKGKVIGVLGSMPDLGVSSSDFHEEIGDLAQKHFDALFCIGEEAKGIAQSFANGGKPSDHFATLSSLKKELFDRIVPGDVVLIKGGNYLKLWEVLSEV
ncbi:MAG: UDP-N-acetylmuramoyl-tripeptide--D-alanyl-D-alanine ligase [Chlamydiae bacterium]|nr:UDP-N-acetylmuramoyl-tripeptide--D-alanyl-D-alanine ligase [Chlamydiota bacterium]